MYLCVNCGELFEEPVQYVETHGFSSPPYETFYGCPSCCEPFVETVRCDECGEWVTGEYIKLNNGYIICSNCYTLRDIVDEV